MYEGGGREALKAKPHPGRTSRLTAEQRESLIYMLLEGPHKYGYDTRMWTLARVAGMIAMNFGVEYHPSSVWHILRALGWRYQTHRHRPQWGERADATWRRRIYPRQRNAGKNPPKPLMPG
jgi:transposase